MNNEDKPKQRAVYFTDNEWERVKEAAKKSEQKHSSNFVNVMTMRAVKRSEK